MKPPRFRPSLAEVKRQNNAVDNYYAVSFGKEPQAQNVVAPKRAAPVRSDGPSEADVLHDIRQAVKTHPRVTLYRNNRGQVILPSGGRLTYGVGPNGAADLLGWREVRITADMVGEKIAQFTALEVKRPGAKPDPEQRAFLDAVYAAGGCSGWADTVEAALAVVERKP